MRPDRKNATWPKTADPAPRPVGNARGILRSQTGPGSFHHARHAPPFNLRGIVAHFWSVRWDLHGHLPQLRETLPHPNMHMVFERGRTRIVGVSRARFSRLLADQGCVFGVKFLPGGFHPFPGRPLSELTDRSLSLHEVFGSAADALDAEVLACTNDTGMIEVAAKFLAAHLPVPDANAASAAAIVGDIELDHALTRVEQLVARYGLGKRTLQRLFDLHVGVSPKWVINRYRLHEAIERLAAGGPADWSALALDLGYFDQAHFIRDFRRLLGRTPGEYAAGDPARD